MNELSDILGKIDMEWLLQREGISYKESYGRSGRQLNAKECPFCNTSEYKVYVNAETGVGNCFSGKCPQKTWNKWTFLKGLFDCNGRQAFEIASNLAREQGWRPKVAPAAGLQDLNTLSLPKSTPAWELDQPIEYLARRGVFADMCRYFNLYWCPDGAWEYMDPRGFNCKQDYSNRILIPIFDLDGELVSFQGRDITGDAEQRYLFPPGFASAGSYLYNAFSVTEDTEALVVCEGVFDVIKAKVAMQNVPEFRDYEPIGTFGMHLSSGNPSGDDQMGRLRKLKTEKGVKRLIFLWDGERKAATAAIEQALVASSMGFDCSIAFMPDGRDPGSAYLHEIWDAVRAAKPCKTPLDAVRLRREVDRYTTA